MFYMEKHRDETKEEEKQAIGYIYSSSFSMFFPRSCSNPKEPELNREKIERPHCKNNILNLMKSTGEIIKLGEQHLKLNSNCTLNYGIFI